MYLLKNRVLDKNFFLFGSFSFLADKKKAAPKDGVNPYRIRSLGEILGPDEPIGPHGHVLDVAIGQAGTVYHPVDVILVIDQDVALGPATQWPGCPNP